MISITALAMVTAADVVRLLFDHGAFDEAALERTATTLAVFLAGLTAHSMIAVLARAFYARQDTATPVGAALVAVASNIVLGLLLIGPLGLAGLAAAIAVSAWLELSVLVVLLRRRVPGLGLGHVGIVMGRTLVAALAGGAVAFVVMEVLVGAWGTDPGLVRLLARLALVTATGAGVIVAVSLALRIEEPRRIFGIVVDLLRRRDRA
jgi:putative peptidoglycan lipid II flippase